MELHRSGAKSDWETVPPGQRSAWQRLAIVSRGLLTPGNVITLIGLLLVMWGALLIFDKHYGSGLLALFIGRIADILDGFMADITRTKSPLGETIDAAADKIALLIVLPALVLNHLLPIAIIFLMFLYSVTNAWSGILSKVKKIPVHPSFEGKLAAGACWVGIAAFLLSATIVSRSAQPWHALSVTIAWGSTVLFVIWGYQASLEYARLLFRKGGGDSLQFHRIILVINPQSSNIHRVKNRADELTRLFPEVPLTILETTDPPSQFVSRLQKALTDNPVPTLIGIGGGDGTVNLVLNSLMNLHSTIDLAATTLLPLWGGNANDFAYMLNGLSSRTSLAQVFALGQPVPIHPFVIKVSRPEKAATTHYAACYASFGASAYTADRLAQSGKDTRLLGKSAVGKIASEVIRVLQAMIEAPLFDAEQNGQQMKIFEQVFSNGSRMAKLDRLPIKLNEKAFYSAVQSEKHPLYLMARLIRGKKFGQVTDKPAHFTIRERTWAQFDGEVTVLPKNTTVSIGLAGTPFYALGTKLSPTTLTLADRSKQRRNWRIFFTILLMIITFHVWLFITNPYSSLSIVQQPYSTYIDNGQIKIKKTFNLNVYSNLGAQWLGYYKSGFLILEHTLSPSHLTDRRSPSQTITNIHEKRFDPSKPYLITGEPFSVLYPRNLGVFYNAILDPRTAQNQADWQHRQQIYLQSALYGLDAFSTSQKLTTTIVPISQHTVVLTEVHPGSVPSDSLYGLLYAFAELSQASPYKSSPYKIQTIAATKAVLTSRRADLHGLLQLYVREVQDPSSGLVRRHLTLSSARDGVIRDSSFYDNVVLWKTLSLASDLGVQHYSPTYLTHLRNSIVNQYWDDQSGIFSDEYRSANQPATFSADWLIALPTGFLNPSNATDRSKLMRMVSYTNQQGLAQPLPIKYTTSGTLIKAPTVVHWFEPNYSGNLIWSYWGAQYITLLDTLFAVTHISSYQHAAGQDLQAYNQVLAHYGGFPETLNPNGTFHQSFFYKSILDTGWVVQYEQAHYEFMHPTP